MIFWINLLDMHLKKDFHGRHLFYPWLFDTGFIIKDEKMLAHIHNFLKTKMFVYALIILAVFMEHVGIGMGWWSGVDWNPLIVLLTLELGFYFATKHLVRGLPTTAKQKSHFQLPTGTVVLLVLELGVLALMVTKMWLVYEGQGELPNIVAIIFLSLCGGFIGDRLYTRYKSH